MPDYPTTKEEALGMNSGNVSVNGILKIIEGDDVGVEE